MKFARDCRSSESNEATAQLLFEALPWIKNLTGKTVVIKYGGAAMVDEQLRRDVMSDIVLLKIIGMRPVIVHGGGKAINEALSHYDIPVEFKNACTVFCIALQFQAKTIDVCIQHIFISKIWFFPNQFI